MPTPLASMLWRGIDPPGHDACRLSSHATGWELKGTAVFLHAHGPAQLHYRLTCDPVWRIRRGEVHGWVGGRSVSMAIARSAAGRWNLDGKDIPGLELCVDLDLGFTPATNLSQLRRLDLAVDETANYSVAWLDVGPGTLQPLVQRYRRLDAHHYAYESPLSGYAATLEVTSEGFITHYPGLWEAERAKATAIDS